MLLSLLLLLITICQQNIVYFIVGALGFSQFYYYYPCRFRIGLRMISFSLSASHRAVLRHLPTHSKSAYFAPSTIVDLVFSLIPQCQPLPNSQKQDDDSDNDQCIIILCLFVCPPPPYFLPPPPPPPPPPHTFFGGVGLMSYFITTIVNHPVFCVLIF